MEPFKYFNQVGKIDEIFGTLRDFFVSVKLSDEVKAHSFKKGQQLFIDPAKMLPLARFLPGGDGQYFFCFACQYYFVHFWFEYCLVINRN